MQRYIIGIDTGGTYTDAVLIDITDKKVIATAKRPTTHQDLALGTGQALADLLQQTGIAPQQIASLAVSSTLATNSVVENKGARVVLLVIGYVRHFKLPVKAVVFIKGGHTMTGKEEEPLDLDYLVEIVHRLQNEVDAYGICSAMSMYNPAHELVAEKAIAMLDPKPVFCSHRISNIAGMKERAATAGLHAKLMPIMQQYIDGVTKAMANLGLACPVFIISGNGKTIDAQTAVSHAGITVASGPACTAHFGALHSSQDCLVVDVGGTTTDIALIKDGKPQLTEEGCKIGEWQTHVEAVDMVTGGIGGDSFARIDENGAVLVGPTRVVPLSMTPDLPDVGNWLGNGETAKLILLRPSREVTIKGDEVLTALAITGHATPLELRRATSLSGIPMDLILEQLSRRQLIYESGFTPTDALHVLGQIDIGNRQVAWNAAEILGAAIGLNAENFSRMILRKTEELIENLILDYIIQHHWGNSLTSFLAERNAHPVLGVNFSLKIPIVGIGAAARYLLPAVAERLQTTVRFPKNCEVGNAIGAAMLSLHQQL
jgi:N-methylhydantoinase A/oxoprolinase/acetone carboxylase beta subunit